MVGGIRLRKLEPGGKGPGGSQGFFFPGGMRNHGVCVGTAERLLQVGLRGMAGGAGTLEAPRGRHPWEKATYGEMALP